MPARNAHRVVAAGSKDRLVPFTSKLAFGVGQFAEGVKNTAFGAFVLFYYNQVLGLPGTLAGAALFIALLFDAVTDPMAGSLSDKTQSRLGRRHPFMYASAVPLGLAFIGLFAPPSDLGDWGLFAWLATFAVLTRMAMTLYHVPHLALGAEMTENFDERTRVVAYRQFFAAGGVLTAYCVGYFGFFGDDRGGRVAIDNYLPYALTLAILMVVTIWYSAYGTQKEIPFLSEPAPRLRHNPLTQAVLDMAEAFRNRSFRWLFFGVLVVFIMAGVNSALDIYMFQYFWDLTGAEMGTLQIASVAGLMTGVFLTAPLLRRTEKRFGVLLGTVVWAVCQVMPVVLRLLDAFPANDTAFLVVTLVAFRFVQGLIVQQAFIAFGSMMADVADEHDVATGARQEGIFFGAIAFSHKATSGFGNFIGGLGLDIISWPTGTQIQSAADVPAETIVHLGLLYGPVVAGFSVISVWCYLHYDLTRARHAEILRELNARRRVEPARDPTPT
ncbi:MAG: MFS transporter [Gammaproteobacteria bacterium]|nr:MFS transporter [Gammaproteobacteria bacterium]